MSIFNPSCFESRKKVTKDAIELKIKENERFDSVGFSKWLNSLSIEEKFLFLEVFLPGKSVKDLLNNVWMFAENGKIYAKEITIKNANTRTIGNWTIKNGQLIIDNWSEEFPGRSNLYKIFLQMNTNTLINFSQRILGYLFPCIRMRSSQVNRISTFSFIGKIKMTRNTMN